MFCISSISEGSEIECDFGDVFKSNRIVTKFHNIDFGRIMSHGTKNVFTYEIMDVLASHIQNNSCHQNVDQLCQPWVQRLYEIDKQHQPKVNSSMPYHVCQCLRYQKVLSHVKTETNYRYAVC